MLDADAVEMALRQLAMGRFLPAGRLARPKPAGRRTPPEPSFTASKENQVDPRWHHPGALLTEMFSYKIFQRGVGLPT